MQGRISVAIVLLLSSFVDSHAAPLPPDNDYLNAVWVAQAKGELKLAAADGRTLCEIPESKGATAIAIDERGGVLWIYAYGHLKSYSFGCTNLSDTSLPPLEHPQLAIHSVDGSVWLGGHRTLHHFTPSGILKASFPLTEGLRALAVDGERGRLWVAAEHSLNEFDSEGLPLKSISLSHRQEIGALELDLAADSLWIANERAVVRVLEDGTTALEVPFHKPKHLSADSAGGLWIASEHHVQHIATDGRVTADFDLSGGHNRGEITAIRTDLTNNSVWIADNKRLLRYSPSGELLRQFDLPPIGVAHHRESADPIRALALYSDRIAPSLSVVAPPEGSYLNTGVPEFKLAYSDVGIGVDTATLKVMCNGAQSNLSCQFDADTALCKPAAAFADGQVALEFSIKDYAGNAAPTTSLSFHVDTVPPIISVEVPLDGTYTNNPQMPLRGVISEPANVSVNGVPLFLNTNNEFGQELTLVEGQNFITVSAMDRAGNRAEKTLAVVLDTVPPADPIIASINVNLNDAGATIIGTPGAVESGSTVIVTNTRTGEVASAIADSTGAFTITVPGNGGDTFSIQVADKAGNRSSTEYLVTLQIKISPLNAAAVDHRQLIVDGEIQGPANAGVAVNGKPATVVGHRFYADIRLEKGANTVTAIATTLFGATASDSVVLTVSENASDPLTVDVETSGGIAPVNARFSPTSGMILPIANISADLNGDGTQEFVSDALPAKPIEYVYASPGVYKPVFTVTDTQGNVFSRTALVVVSDAKEVDSVLLSLWTGLSEALKSGNVSRSAAFLNQRARDKYAPVFEALKGNSAAIFASCSQPERVSATQEFGEYAVVREHQGKRLLYLIYFMKDTDGVWRIDSL